MTPPQVVEQWSSGNVVLHYGRDGGLAGSGREHQEISVLVLHGAFAPGLDTRLDFALVGPGSHPAVAPGPQDR
jgi:hypothetical protein